ncbi:MAG: NUDIX hydrolase [Chlamydiia bacterium]|nr:NUDIX hydrolase [Chlamydiia bacterium]
MRIICLLLLGCSLFGEPAQDYFDFLLAHPKTHGLLGSYEKGEIEILTQPHSIEEVERIAMRRLLDKGVDIDYAKEWSRTGIIAEDQYLFWVRDAVIFPSGEKGTYDRILWKSGLESNPGVAVLPYLADYRIVLVLHYRHATRSWELELPRGMIRAGETIRTAATRELLEETGFRADDSLLLGTIAVDSGIFTSLVPILACKAVQVDEIQPDYSEAISHVVTLTLKEIDQALLKGFWDVSLEERTIRAAVRDPFLTYALFQMKLRHWQD